MAICCLLQRLNAVHEIFCIIFLQRIRHTFFAHINKRVVFEQSITILYDLNDFFICSYIVSISPADFSLLKSFLNKKVQLLKHNRFLGIDLITLKLFLAITCQSGKNPITR